MVGQSRPLISGLDGLICVVLSIVLHILGIRAIPWERSKQVEQSSAMAIELINLPANSLPQTPSTLESLKEIPLHDPSGIIEPSRMIAGTPTEEPQTGSEAQIPPVPDLPPTIPLPDSPPSAEGSKLQVSLAEPLFATPSPSPIPPSPPETLPAVPVFPKTTPIARITPPASGATPMAEVTIGGEVQVAANPSPVQFRVLLEVLSNPVPSPVPSPDYTPPLPRYQALILTADPLTRRCTVPTLQAVQDSGYPLSFEVAIDVEGKVTRATPTATVGDSTSADYQSWATCLLLDWPFEPAQVQQTPVTGSLEIGVTIQVLSASP